MTQVAPGPGGVGWLPGTAFLTCPRCYETSVLFVGKVTFPLSYDCNGCEIHWTVMEPLPEHTAYRWFERKDPANADPAAL